MNFEILREIPPSGSILERHYHVGGVGTWIRFELPDSEWVGVFGQGPSNRTSVHSFDDGRLALVIAHGRGYVVDCGTGALFYRTSIDYLWDATAVEGTDCIAAVDFINVHLYSREGLRWSAEDIASDGIELKSANQKEIVGDAWHWEAWRNFKLDTISGEILEGCRAR